MPWNMFLETDDAAIRRYESEELMVAARIPAITKPASRGGSRLLDRTINTFSAPEAVNLRKKGTLPPNCKRPKPGWKPKIKMANTI